MAAGNPHLLQQLQIASPCRANWQAMSGDERVRFCQQCELHVYDLSELSADEAVDLVSKAEGRLCVRFFRRADSTVLTRDCPVGHARVQRRLKLVAAGLASVMAMASAGVLLAVGAKAVEASVAISSPAGTAPPITSSLVSSIHSAWSSVWNWLYPPVQGQVLMGDICLPPPPVLVAPPIGSPGGSTSAEPNAEQSE